jgi:two-component system, NarL family, response regulator LiaR
MNTKILIVEDQQTIRQGLRLILAGFPNVEVVGEAADGYTAITMTERLQPNLILMDVGLPGIDGIESVRRIKASKPHIKVLMFTSHDDEDEIRASLGAGADGYCLKSLFGENLKTAITAVMAGQIWLDAAIADRVLREYTKAKSSGDASGQSAGQAPPHNQQGPDFTDRELAVLEALVGGLNNSQIAGRLACSGDAVTDNIRSILRKLQVVELPHMSN